MELNFRFKFVSALKTNKQKTKKRKNPKDFETTSMIYDPDAARPNEFYQDGALQRGLRTGSPAGQPPQISDLVTFPEPGGKVRLENERKSPPTGLEAAAGTPEPEPGEGPWAARGPAARLQVKTRLSEAVRAPLSREQVGGSCFPPQDGPGSEGLSSVALPSQFVKVPHRINSCLPRPL